MVMVLRYIHVAIVLALKNDHQVHHCVNRRYLKLVPRRWLLNKKKCVNMSINPFAVQLLGGRGGGSAKSRLR